ncbi:hypothetical protein DERP_012113 [Dermatophagoides pteronyssinus]|uniref:Uncharacterized protein n=1 Tax=Dermatophagoides pteronyssinus TaxID=6956 RepID=A0ABQ8ITY0_DERPT|nr:hypothetical protein DERP_012113 [Dermatophagoides pteronyssinus]
MNFVSNFHNITKFRILWCSIIDINLDILFQQQQKHNIYSKSQKKNENNRALMFVEKKISLSSIYSTFFKFIIIILVILLKYNSILGSVGSSTPRSSFIVPPGVVAGANNNRNGIGSDGSNSFDTISIGVNHHSIVSSPYVIKGNSGGGIGGINISTGGDEEEEEDDDDGEEEEEEIINLPTNSNIDHRQSIQSTSLTSKRGSFNQRTRFRSGSGGLLIRRQLSSKARPNSSVLFQRHASLGCSPNRRNRAINFERSDDQNLTENSGPHISTPFWHSNYRSVVTTATTGSSPHLGSSFGGGSNPLQLCRCSSGGDPLSLPSASNTPPPHTSSSTVPPQTPPPSHYQYQQNQHYHQLPPHSSNSYNQQPQQTQYGSHYGSSNILGANCIGIGASSSSAATTVAPLLPVTNDSPASYRSGHQLSQTTNDHNSATIQPGDSHIHPPSLPPQHQLHHHPHQPVPQPSHQHSGPPIQSSHPTSHSRPGTSGGNGAGDDSGLPKATFRVFQNLTPRRSSQSQANRTFVRRGFQIGDNLRSSSSVMHRHTSHGPFSSSSAPLMKLSTLVIVLLAFLIIGFIVLSPLFHYLM